MNTRDIGAARFNEGGFQYQVISGAGCIGLVTCCNYLGNSLSDMGPKGGGTMVCSTTMTAEALLISPSQWKASGELAMVSIFICNRALI